MCICMPAIQGACPVLCRRGAHSAAVCRSICAAFLGEHRCAQQPLCVKVRVHAALQGGRKYLPRAHGAAQPLCCFCRSFSAAFCRDALRVAQDPLADAQAQVAFRGARTVCPDLLRRPFCPGGRGLCPACFKEPQPCGIRCARSRIPGCPCPAMQLCIALSVQPAEQQRAAAVHAASPATMHTPSLTEIS